MGSCLMNIEFQFFKMKIAGDLSYNNVNIPNTIELHAEKWLRQ